MQCALHGMLMTSQVPSKSVLIRVDELGKYTHLAVGPGEPIHFARACALPLRAFDTTLRLLAPFRIFAV